MSDEMWQLLAAAAITVMQVYATEPWKFTAIARFWDWLAKITGELANALGRISMQARINYFDAIAVGE